MGIRRTEIRQRRTRRAKRAVLLARLAKAAERDRAPILDRLEKTFPLVASRRTAMEAALAQHEQAKRPRV